MYAMDAIRCDLVLSTYTVASFTIHPPFPPLCAIALQGYLAKVDRLLVDDGTFLMQVAGLRKGCDYEDMAWGLLMNRYIFPGATASTPLYWYIQEMEKAGFEVESVENLGPHYSLTLNQW